LKQENFIQLNSDIWKELQLFIDKINKKGVSKLSSKDLKRFLHIFRLTSHHLAYVRTHYPKSDLLNYLNSLVGKCHSHVYAVKRFSIKDLNNYILYGFPNLLKTNKFYILFSFLFFILGSIISFLVVIKNPELSDIFLPSYFYETIKNNKMGQGDFNYPLMSSTIMVNNILVSLRAFVFGITFGIGTIYVLFINGIMLGALTALVYLYADQVLFWSLILPHGIIELSAIFIAGGAGLIIARGMLLPYEYSRKDSIIKASKEAVSLILGVIFMLIVASIIEGFFTPLPISPYIKLSFAAFTAILSIIYFSLPYIKKMK